MHVALQFDEFLVVIRNYTVNSERKVENNAMAQLIILQVPNTYLT